MWHWSLSHGGSVLCGDAGARAPSTWCSCTTGRLPAVATDGQPWKSMAEARHRPKGHGLEAAPLPLKFHRRAISPLVTPYGEGDTVPKSGHEWFRSDSALWRKGRSGSARHLTYCPAAHFPLSAGWVRSGLPRDCREEATAVPASPTNHSLVSSTVPPMLQAPAQAGVQL